MASLYYHYSTMNAGKTTICLQNAHNYEERGMQVALFKPDVDTRDTSDPIIKSRIGLEKPCVLVKPDDDLYLKVVEHYRDRACVFVDEAQFLTYQQVVGLARVVDNLGIPVLCYGLRTDFQGRLFPGSGALLALADKIKEVKTICHCGRKATMVLRLSPEGVVLRTGPQVEIGGNDRYVSVCRKHFLEGDAG